MTDIAEDQLPIAEDWLVSTCVHWGLCTPRPRVYIDLLIDIYTPCNINAQWRGAQTTHAGCARRLYMSRLDARGDVGLACWQVVSRVPACLPAAYLKRWC